MSVSITKQSITLAFFKLLYEKPYKKITVSDVTEKAGVNRMTFYYHFKDIDDLVLKKIEEEFLEICKSALALGELSNAYLNVYLLVARHKELAKKIYPEFDMHRLISFLSPLAFKLASSLVKKNAKNHISGKLEEALTHSVACCMIGSFIEWLNSDMENDPREIAANQSLILDAAINGAINKGKA